MTITLSARPSYTSLSAGAPGCSAPGGAGESHLNFWIETRTVLRFD